MRETKRNLEEAVIPDVLNVMYDFGAFGTKEDFAGFLGTNATQVWRWKTGENEPQPYNLDFDWTVKLMDQLYERNKVSDVAVKSLLEKLEEQGFEVAEYQGRVQDPSGQDSAAADGQNRRVFDRIVAQFAGAAFKNRKKKQKQNGRPAVKKMEDGPKTEAVQSAESAAEPAGLCLKGLRSVLEDAGMWCADDGEFLRCLLPSTLLYAVPEVETDAAVMEGIHSPQLRQKIFEKLAHDSRLTVRDLIKRSNALLRELDRDRYLSGAERLLEALGTETAGLLRLKRCHQICGSRSDGSGLAVLVVFALLDEAYFVRLIKSDRDFDFFNA